jgi:hypothetical protein
LRIFPGWLQSPPGSASDAAACLVALIVFVKPVPGQTLDGPARTACVELSQKQCVYEPHVIAVQTGELLEITHTTCPGL